MIQYVRNYKVNKKNIDFGYYINADDIASQLATDKFYFNSFDIFASNKEFKTTVLASGLINDDFTKEDFDNSYLLRANKLTLKIAGAIERVSQIIADFLRKKMLQERKRFSFETVFSHNSKLEIMRLAKEQGYKVYLYFVSTESPEINKFRVKSRVAQGGHSVPGDKIESRYYRSLELLYEATKIAYQVYFFDNSENNKDSRLFAHFKIEKGRQKWNNDYDESSLPVWFVEYFLDKSNEV
ncbi:MAG: hypothetical protein H7258_06360 [Ferruginibacter sp.]|nr:hypothetical protein [Ferruginibacter sp.]